MTLTAADWIGSLGVGILLIAYLLNLLGRLSQNSVGYVLLNLIGAAIAGIASVLLMYWPFIILEAVWTVVSAIALIRAIRSPKA